MGVVPHLDQGTKKQMLTAYKAHILKAKKQYNKIIPESLGDLNLI